MDTFFAATRIENHANGHGVNVISSSIGYLLPL